MGTQKSPCLPGRFELPKCRTTHPTFSHSGHFVRLLGPIIGIAIIYVDGLRNQFTMRDTITTQLVRHDLPRLTTMPPPQPLGIFSSEFNTPEANGLVANSDATLRE